MRRALLILGIGAVLVGCGPSDPLAGYRDEIEPLAASDETVVLLSRRAEIMDAASELFITNCAACHNAKGTGLTGPNLTDDAYLDIESPVDLYWVITDGRHAKGMPAWDRSLDDAERLALAAYTAELRGSAEGGKKPEGEIIPAWETFLSE
jgi:mono/diheme cytochrome c family protein